MVDFERAHDHATAQPLVDHNVRKCRPSSATLDRMAQIKRKKGKGLDPIQSDRLRAYLRDTGLSQTELARRANMTPGAFSRFFSGSSHGSVDMVFALSDDLGVDLWEAITMRAGEDSKNFETAAKTVSGSVSEEAIARVRLFVRFPASAGDPPIAWWVRRLHLEQELVEHQARLDSVPKRAKVGA